MDIWRISNFVDLSGRGGLLTDGRWHSRSLPIVYCADHPSTAMLEVLVHVDAEDVPGTYQLLRITCPDDVPQHRIDNLDITDLAMTRSVGTNFLTENRGLLLNVPSIVMPAARNILINPRHARASDLEIADIFHYPFDRRLKG
jgi:RES domain-containing protein